ncbi:MAG: hypothetical protein CMJ46_00025 [Planctomyces sp.]|nr:hypothetical protein [Planctomyces sp.]
MTAALNERIQQAKENLRRFQKIESLLLAKIARLQSEVDYCKQLKARWQAEQADVKRLEGLSITGLFYTVLGSREQQLEKERQEMLAAWLKYEESEETIAEIKAEIESLKADKSKFTTAESDYQRLVAEKEEWLRNAGTPEGAWLIEVSDELAELDSDYRELSEAIQAGEAALNHLKSTQSSLNSAGNWGTWDMLGGGSISTFVKHSRLDDARSHAHRAQRELAHFQEELADVSQRIHIDLKIDGLTSFADYFFDGLIVDWLVQSRINKAQSSCANAIEAVRGLLSQCRHQRADLTDRIESLTSERKRILDQNGVV